MSSRYVVTAAHCLFPFWNFKKCVNKTRPYEPYELRVRLGDHDLDHRTGEGSLPDKTFKIKNITIHHGYDHSLEPFNDIDDIALLELEDDVDLNVYTPVCLAQETDTDSFYNKVAQVYGWGYTRGDECRKFKSPTLMEVDVPVVQQCNYQNFGGKICAGGATDKDSCNVSEGFKKTLVQIF